MLSISSMRARFQERGRIPAVSSVCMARMARTAIQERAVRGLRKSCNMWAPSVRGKPLAEGKRAAAKKKCPEACVRPSPAALPCRAQKISWTAGRADGGTGEGSTNHPGRGSGEREEVYPACRVVVQEMFGRGTCRACPLHVPID